jgi:lysophospholipase L1-like esterase
LSALVEPRKLWVLRIATGGVAAALCIGALPLIVSAYLGYCRWTGLNPDTRLQQSALAQRIWLRRGYRELLQSVGLTAAGGRTDSSGEFQTVEDFNAMAFLSKEQFVPTEMYGEPRYRYQPNLRARDFTVWSGLWFKSLSALDSPVLNEQLRRHPAVRDVLVETDSLGFRRTGFPVDLREPSVLFLGDSFTEGMHVRSEDTFVNLYGLAMLRAGIRSYPINAGVDGYGTLEEAWTAERFVGPMKARLVIVNLFLNDVELNYHKVIKGGGFPESNYGEMFRYLRRLTDHCRARGADVVIAVIPAKEQIRLFPRGTSFQDRVRSWCGRQGVLFLDPLPHLRRVGGEGNYIPWDPHLDVEGHRNYADFLFRTTRPLLDCAFGTAQHEEVPVLPAGRR